MDELAGLADGTLTGRRRARALRAVASSPELAELLAEQERVVALVRGAAPEVPHALRERVDAESARLAPGAGRVRRLRRALPVGVAAVVLVVVVVFSSRAGGLAVEDAAALAERRPERAFVAPVVEAGIGFPDWTGEFGWRPVGVRDDSPDGRDTTTVFYDKAGNRIGYTIVNGEPLEGTPSEPELRDDGRRLVVIWQRDGHTCVISAPEGVKPEVLLKLARAETG